MADPAVALPRYGAYGGTLIAINTVCFAIALAVFAVRVYTKYAIVKRAHWDDVTLALGMIFLIVTYAGSIAATANSGNLVLVPDLHDNAESNARVRTIWLESSFLSLALGFIKLSVLLMLYTIFRPFQWMRISTYVGFVLIAGFYGGFWIYVMVAITPRPGMSWVQMATRPEVFNASRANIPQGIVSLIFDICLLILPIRAVMSLQMTLQRKLGVGLIFASGLLACVASGLSLGYRFRLNDVAIDTSNLVPFQICVQAEMNAGVLCVCMPSVAKAISFHRPWFVGLKQRLSAVFHLRPSLRETKEGYQRQPVPSSADPSPEYELQRRELDRRQEIDSNMMVNIKTEISVTEEQRTRSSTKTMGPRLRNDLLPDSPVD